MLRARIFVKGLVQGVGFRSFARNNARSMGLRGYVRNTAAGDLEIIAEGYRNDIDKFISFLRQGPFHSQVNDIEIEWEEPTGEFREFEVRL